MRLKLLKGTIADLAEFGFSDGYGSGYGYGYGHGYGYGSGSGFGFEVDNGLEAEISEKPERVK